ncbi:Pectinesterase inhibitor 6 [Linum grandiflorum]
MLTLISSSPVSYSSSSSSSYVEQACSVTKYKAICIHSLASFSRTAKSSPSKWARAGVSVTLSESSNLTRFLTHLFVHSSSSQFRSGSRNRAALSDCVECFHDAVDSLHLSLGVVRNLEVANFDAQMEDLTTWLSAALTNGDTCLDGFVEDGGHKSEVEMVKGRVRRVGYITSNALALVNRLAATGLETTKPTTNLT